MSLQPGDFVIIENTVHPMHHVGRLLGRAESQTDTWWVDLNISGSHLPQMYREDDLVEIPFDLPLVAPILEHHGFCNMCRGWGVDGQEPFTVGEGFRFDRARCPDCGGSGKSCMKTTFAVENSSTTEVHIEIDTEAVQSIACDGCRTALQPL